MVCGRHVGCVADGCGEFGRQRVLARQRGDGLAGRAGAGRAGVGSLRLGSRCGARAALRGRISPFVPCSVDPGPGGVAPLRRAAGGVGVLVTSACGRVVVTLEDPAGPASSHVPPRFGPGQLGPARAAIVPPVPARWRAAARRAARLAPVGAGRAAAVGDAGSGAASAAAGPRGRRTAVGAWSIGAAAAWGPGGPRRVAVLLPSPLLPLLRRGPLPAPGRGCRDVAPVPREDAPVPDRADRVAGRPRVAPPPLPERAAEGLPLADPRVLGVPDRAAPVPGLRDGRDPVPPWRAPGSGIAGTRARGA